MGKSKLKPGRRFVFTEYDTREERKDDWKKLPKNMRFIEFQLEKCPTTGNLHYQGYCTFKYPVRKTQLDKIFNKYHAENMRAGIKKNEIYCTKGETRVSGPWNYGDRPLDLEISLKGEKLIEFVKEGAPDIEIFEQLPLIYLRNNIQKARQLYVKDRDPNVQPEIIIYWGESGTGKSRLASQLYPNAYYAKLNDKNFPFDGYNSEDTIVFDEFRCQIRLCDLLSVVDRYKCNINVKYGSIKMVATKFIFTSNLNPLNWYSNCSVYDKKPLRRRIKEWGKIYEFRDNVVIINDI